MNFKPLYENKLQFSIVYWRWIVQLHICHYLNYLINSIWQIPLLYITLKIQMLCFQKCEATSRKIPPFSHYCFISNGNNRSSAAADNSYQVRAADIVFINKKIFLIRVGCSSISHGLCYCRVQDSLLEVPETQAGKFFGVLFNKYICALKQNGVVVIQKIYCYWEGEHGTVPTPPHYVP